MTLRKFIVLVSFLLFICPPVAIPAQERGIKLSAERLALVIGNSAYQTAPLKNPVNDAEDMAAVLKDLGFRVILKKDADQRTMEDAVRYFGKQLSNGGTGLFYFAGHGIQMEGRNYLMPIDARIETESDVKYEALDAGRVLGKMEDARNQLNIVILDACRNNPYARAFRTDQRGLARMDAPTGSLIAYATAPGEVAADGPERNGIFTKYLIQHMTTPNLSIEHLLKRVRIDVAKQTNGRQIPWEASSLMGDFYFKHKNSKIKTNKTTKPKIPSESGSENQVASISDDKKRNVDPWSGKWKVEGHGNLRGLWVLKQNGKTVVSTKDSTYDIKGKIKGDYFIGGLKPVGFSDYYFSLDLKISSDGKTITGTATGKAVRDSGFIKGRKQY